ncbi:MAG: adenylate/guanylate cyclase domain-containing protein, partial [Bacteroidetes bacterium]|nr:adenylate/guanylate cyclase domain-containing protein [Bacteroidota bacterium]
IQENHGFVNQFLGDGIMALFQRSSSDALNTAIEMQRELQRYNKKRVKKNRMPINVGIGFHTGELIMGIIGDRGRSDAAIISDTVNTAARLEGLTKYYYAKILLSSNSYESLSPEQKKHCRFLGLVQVKGKLEPLGIYEAIEGEAGEMRNLKLETMEDFHRGLDDYLRGEFTSAISLFEKVLAKNPNDQTAAHILTKTRSAFDSGLIDDWDGVERMMAK